MQLHNHTLLRRVGNKGKLLPWLLPCFPREIVSLIEPFAGTLAVSLAMLRAGRCRYCFCNDIDGEVVNLWLVLRDQKDALLDALTCTPVHAAIFQDFKTTIPPDPVWRAVRLLYLSNFSYLGTGDTLKLGQDHSRARLLADLRRFQADTLNHIKFLSCDFREVLDSIALRTDSSHNERETAFVYCDPPYVGTQCNYAGFVLSDLKDLLDLLVASGLRFAVSEFASPEVLELVAAYPVQVHRFPARRTLGNRTQEILIYAGYTLESPQLTLFPEEREKTLDSSFYNL